MSITSTENVNRSAAALPTVHIDTNAANKLTIAAASARTASAINCKYLYLVPTTPCFIKFGDGTVVAVNTGINSAYLPANIPLIIDWKPGDFLAVIDVSGGPGGTLYFAAVY